MSACDTTDEIVAEIKQYDMEPPLTLLLLDDKRPVDLTLADTVRLIIAKDGEVYVDSFCQVLDQLTFRGQVQRPWGFGDTDVPGLYVAEAEVTWSNGRIQTFPADGYFYVRITPDLG